MAANVWSDAARDASAAARHSDISNYLRKSYIGGKYKEAQDSAVKAHEASADAFKSGNFEKHNEARILHEKTSELHHANGASGAGNYHAEMAAQHASYAPKSQEQLRQKYGENHNPAGRLGGK